MNNKVSIKKWGNSLEFGIPSDIAKSLSIESDTVVELKLEGDRLNRKKAESLPNLDTILDRKIAL